MLFNVSNIIKVDVTEFFRNEWIEARRILLSFDYTNATMRSRMQTRRVIAPGAVALRFAFKCLNSSSQSVVITAPGASFVSL